MRIYTVIDTRTGKPAIDPLTGRPLLVEARAPLQACSAARRASRPDYVARVATQAELLAAAPADVLRAHAAGMLQAELPIDDAAGDAADADDAEGV
jgi:hypothetical protein